MIEICSLYSKRPTYYMDRNPLSCCWCPQSCTRRARTFSKRMSVLRQIGRKLTRFSVSSLNLSSEASWLPSKRRRFVRSIGVSGSGTISGRASGVFDRGFDRLLCRLENRRDVKEDKNLLSGRRSSSGTSPTVWTSGTVSGSLSTAVTVTTKSRGWF